MQSKRILVWGCMLLLLLALAACGKTEEKVAQDQIETAAKDETKKEAANEKEAVEEEEVEKVEETTVSYTTINGEEVVIPSKPQRVVYLGDKLIDFLALELPIVGSNLVNAKGMFNEGKLTNIVDVGNPGELELIMSVEPDLIINSYSKDEAHHQLLSKIAPTIPFNSALPYKERVTEIGKIFSMEEITGQWIAKFEAQSKEMWEKLQLAEGESATVFLQLGKTLYVMGNRSLGAILYDENGFAIPPAVQKDIIDEGLTFATVSEELLADFAGDHLFVLVQNNDESKAESNRIMESPLWKAVPAVKQGHVYSVSADWNTDGLLALEQLLESLPSWMNR